MCLVDSAKRIIKNVANTLFDDWFTIQGYGPVQVKLKESQVVQSHHVIDVLVGERDRVDQPDLLAEQLCSEVGGCVDQQISLGKPDDGATASSPIERIATLADGAATANDGHAYGRPRAQ